MDPRIPRRHIRQIDQLKVFGSPVVVPTGVNARGDIVGVYLGSDNQPHGFLIHHGEAQDIGTLGGSSAVANAISNNGVVVGASATAGGAIHAVEYDRASCTILARRYPQTVTVRPFGQQSGYRGGSVRPIAPQFCRRDLQDGHVASIGTLGGGTSAATDINDGGVVVGFSQMSNGVEHAFLYAGSRQATGCRISGPWEG